MESTEATTRVAAECLGWDDRLGTVEAGKLADSVIAEKDPLADIRSLENQEHFVLIVQDGVVVKNGLRM